MRYLPMKNLKANELTWRSAGGSNSYTFNHAFKLSFRTRLCWCEKKKALYEFNKIVKKEGGKFDFQYKNQMTRIFNQEEVEAPVIGKTLRRWAWQSLRFEVPHNVGPVPAHPSVRLYVRPSIHPSVRPSNRPSVHPSIRPSVHPSIRLSVRPCVYITKCLLQRYEADLTKISKTNQGNEAFPPCHVLPVWIHPFRRGLET